MPSEGFSPDRLRRLVEGAAAVAGQTDLRTLLGTAIETAVELTGARYGALGVLGDDGTLAEFLHTGLDPKTAAAIEKLPRGDGVLGVVGRIGKTVRVDRVEEHPAAVGFPEHHPVMTSFLGVPIRAGRDLFGNLYLCDKEGGFSAEDEATVEALAIIVGSAVRTVRLQGRLRRLAVVEDRERIARDLHDAIIQDLFAVGLSIQAQSARVAEPEVRAALENAVSSLDQTIASLRQFIFDLNHPHGDAPDIRTEIRDLVTRLAGPHDVEVEVSYTGHFDGLPRRLVNDTVQLVRESLSNALRHSGSPRISVQIDGGDATLSVTVQDRGIGFDPETATWGLGLVNLHRRAERAGGRVEIDSTRGEGTTVRARLPIAGRVPALEGDRVPT